MTTTHERPSRMQQLRSATADTHHNVDTSIMAQNPFANKQNYAQFLTLQYYFLLEVDALYHSDALTQVVPDLKKRHRLFMLEQDFYDLGLPLPTKAFSPLAYKSDCIATALGWLYVVEGSKAGAAILAKQVSEQLGFDQNHGARFLAGPGSGRGSAWRTLMEIINNVPLDETQVQQLTDGANQAFARFGQLQQHVYA